MSKIFNKSKWVVAFIAIFLILGSNSPVSSNVDISAGERNSDVRAIEELRKLKQKVGEVREPEQRIDLEEKVDQQKKVVERQRKALDKGGEMVPAVEDALLPSEPKFLIRKFVLNGATLFTDKDFEVILGKYRDRELGIKDLSKIADEITRFYRDKGYITSFAYLPPQEITAQTVEFRVVEGRVGEVTIEEGKYHSKETIGRKFLVEKGEILSYERLRQSIKRINRHPGRTVNAVLKPGKEDGTSDILLKFEEEEKPRRFYLEYSNRGTEATGKDRYGIGFVHTNLRGDDDILSAKFRMGRDFDVYAISADYNFPISRYDTRLGIHGAYSHADIGGQFAILGPEGRASAFGAYLTHPLFDKDFLEPVPLNLSSSVTLGLDKVDVKNRLLGRVTSHDKLTVARAGISFDQRDRLGRTFFSMEIRRGIKNFLGSMDKDDPMASRLGAGGEFTKYVGSLNRTMRLPFSSLLIASLRGQFTDSPLVSSEQLGFGGADSIRGFPENKYVADYGWMSTLELRTPAFIFPSGLKVPAGKEKERVSLRDVMQFVYFVDFGEGRLKKVRAGEKPDRFLVGAGLGLRFELFDHLSGRIDWGFPVDRKADDPSSTVHIGIMFTARF